MSDAFFEKPILNSPYDYPGEHWELDPGGQPTGKTLKERRKCAYFTPIPKSKKRRESTAEQPDLFADQPKITVDGQEYDPTSIVNEVRSHVDIWRELPKSQWGVTAETSRLLDHWRNYDFTGIKPFFCQLEAVETAIWLAEVAPKTHGKKFSEYLKAANLEANPELFRLALKLATGAGKTMVMSMLIAWQTVNAIRTPNSKKYSRAFLIIAPGITIRDRLRVLLPNDPESYYKKRDILPRDMMPEIEKAKVVITNYHAFRLREKLDIAAGTRSLIQGPTGSPLDTKETEGEMVRRVMGDLMGMKNITVINDEAHHCYRAKVGAGAEDTVEDLTGDEKKLAEAENKYARMWINGIEAVNRQLGVGTVYDLSATPFFLRGSGYREGTLFPWVMSDFSLMDAIECGIVKLPRVPIADNLPDSQDTMPKLRNLWEHIGKHMPKKGKGSASADPRQLPALLQTALEALYGHYEKTFHLWEKSGIEVPPVFIVVCNNVTTSKAVYDYISGWVWKNPDETETFNQGRLPLFQNYDEHGQRLDKPNTLLIDSQQIESGEALSKDFRESFGPEIEKFRREIVERTGDRNAGDKIPDEDLLREVMNTVGTKGSLGASIRCVVSVSMLTEGWDANTVTHILGVRAFGTQLLCEQVVGRGLRRVSYELNDEGKFDVEYSDILGIPFDFTAHPVVANPKPPPKTNRIKALRPERDHLEITFPRVVGYRIDLPNEALDATFTADSKLDITPHDVGPTRVDNAGIIGEGVELTVERLRTTRPSTISYELAKHLVFTKFSDLEGNPKMHLFIPLQRIARRWLNECLTCKGDTFPAQILYADLKEKACERIMAAITNQYLGSRPVKAMIDPYNPTGSSAHVNFTTSKDTLWATKMDRSQVNYVVYDSEWEAQLCRALENHPRVVRYVKNHNLGLEVPYRIGSENHLYLPDFIVCVDDGRGEDDLLNLIMEVKGYRRENDKDKQNAMQTYWIPGVNHLKTYGRWAFAEFTDVFAMDSELESVINQKVNEIIESVAGATGK